MFALLLVAARLAAAPAFCQADLVNEAKELGSVRAVRRRNDILTVRFPTWEIAAVRSAAFLTGPLTPLTTSELTVARSVFGDCVDLDAVRVTFTDVNPFKDAMTWGNVIRVKRSAGYNNTLLIHELVHVWQYQTSGSAYISDSLLHNAESVLTTGKFDKAYEYKIVPDKSFFDYQAEQQAEIVEDYYSSSTHHVDPGYIRLVAEMRTSKALKHSEVLFEEQAAGAPPRGWDPGPVWGKVPFAEGGTIPLVEFRFPGL